jgi:hypothetical protein
MDIPGKWHFELVTADMMVSTELKTSYIPAKQAFKL